MRGIPIHTNPKKIISSIFLLAIIISPILSQFESYYKPRECSKCRCYRIKCSRIENYVDSCEDEYKDSCDHPDDITDENGCNIACGCCLENQCYHWLHYYCLMFRSFEFFTAINFLAVSAHFFALIKLTSYFFFFKQKWNKKSLEQDGDNPEERPNEKRFFCSFRHMIFVSANAQTFNKVPEVYKEAITDLFERIHSLKSLGVKNIIILVLLLVLYLAQITLHFIVTFVAPEKPKFYGHICWVQHTILVTFWIILYKSLSKKGTSYAKGIINVFSDFEDKQKCSYRILPKNKIIEFNFDIKQDSEDEDYSDSADSRQLFPSDHNFDDSMKEDMEESDLIKKNQIKPVKISKKKKKGKSRSTKGGKDKKKKKKRSKRKEV